MDPKADDFSTKINQKTEYFFADLDNYKTQYMNYTQEQDDISYGAAVERLQNSNTDLFIIANEIKMANDNLKKYTQVKLQQINSERELNETNQSTFSDIQESNSGAKIMINDYKTEYNTQYYKNVELFIGILFMVGVSYKIFRK